MKYKYSKYLVKNHGIVKIKHCVSWNHYVEIGTICTSYTLCAHYIVNMTVSLIELEFMAQFCLSLQKSEFYATQQQAGQGNPEEQ